MKIFIICIITLINIPLVNFANTYYVATSGNDTNPGTETQPWSSIQKAVNSLISGDTVYIKSGTYSERVIIQNSGTLNNNIVFSNYQNDTVIIDGTGINWGANWNGLFDISGKNYITIHGLDIQNADYGGFWIENSDNITIENCHTYNTFSSGIGVWNSNHIIIKNNEIELACNDGEQECITIANSNNCEIYGNNVHDNGQGTNGGEGIDIKQGSYNINVYNNVVHHLNNRLGIYADAWNLHTYNINIYQNIIHHCSETGLAVASENGGLIENVNIYNNIIYLNKYGGIELGSWSDIGFTGVKPLSNIKIINNTCYKNGKYDNGWGFGIVIDNPDANNVIIRNNICSNNSAQISFQQIGNGGVLDHNLLYGNNSASGTLFGTDSILENPLFVDTTIYDFHLSLNSPAIDNGNSVDAPIVDFDDNNRPFGSGFDIGAYEYSTLLNIQNNKLHESFFEIYPNPCSEKLTLEIKGKNYQNYTLQLFDSKGILIHNVKYSNINNNSIEFYTKNLNHGIYSLVILNDNQPIGYKKVLIK